MLKTRSDALLVWQVNPSTSTGGSLVSIVNSGGWAVSSTILNSAGWIVNVANTGGVVSIANSSAWSVSSTILNSGGWIVNVANTGGVVSIANSAAWAVSATILNSGGWIIANTGRTDIILNSGGLYSMQSGAWAVSSTILNSAGWIVSASATILNSAGWVVAQSNTAGMTVAIIGGSINVVNTAGWVLSVANTEGTYTTTYDTSIAYDGTTALTMQYGSINITNSTNTIIVNAQSGKRIRVVSLALIAQLTGLLTWQSGSSSGIGLTGPMYLAANVGYVLPFHPNGWFQTQTSTQLNASWSVASSIGGCITYLVTS